ncbi:MAG: Y-family DNA polymerase [Terriglobales bacterium]
MFLCLHLPLLPLQALPCPPGRTAAPAVVIEEDGAVMTILAVNGAARRAGIAVGQTAVPAQAHCPELVLLPRARAAELDLVTRVRRELEATAPLIESLAPEWWLLDLRGLERLKGDAATIAADLLERLRAQRVHGQVGVASNRATAMLAAAGARAVPGTISPPLAVWIIPCGQEAVALAGLPLAALRLFAHFTLEEAAGQVRARKAAEDIGAALETLERWGLRRMGELAALPAVALSERLGPLGVRLRALARGAETSLLRPLPALDNLRELILEFDPPLEDSQTLQAALRAKLAALEPQLQSPERLIEHVEVRLTLVPRCDFLLEASPVQGQALSAHPPQSPASWSCERRLLVPTRTTRDLCRQLALDLEARPPGAAVRAAQVRCRLVAPRRIQQRLFGEAAPDPEKMPKLLARLAELLDDPVYAHIGSPELLDTYHPDAYLLRPFEPGRVPAASRRPATAAQTGPVPELACRPPRMPAANTRSVRTYGGAESRALRRFRPAVPARLLAADMKLGARLWFPPAQPADGARPEGTLTVVRCAGPWRSSGEWWGEQAWAEDEWDVELSDGAFYRLVTCAGEWRAAGKYD